MVRFHWHVEDGLGACVGPGQLVYLRDHGVLQAMVEIEMSGHAGSLEACMTIPQNYNTDSGVKEVGVLLAHGCDASDWRGRLLTELAVLLARAGFLVVRYIAPPGASEARKVAAFEKAADVAATSPYARGVTRWVLAGLGSGARVAAAAGGRVRSGVAGYVFLSYPLREEMPCMVEESPEGAPAPAPPAALAASSDSSGPLMPLAAPLLFVSASGDPGVTEGALVELGPRLATPDVRSVVLPDVDPHFRTLTGKGPHAATVRAIAGTLLEFLAAANAYRMDLCKLTRIWRGGGVAGLGLGMGGQAAAAAAGAGGGGGNGEGTEGGSSGEGKAAAEGGARVQLQRPACFRPIPAGPPPQVQLQVAQQQQQQQLQQQLLAAAAAGHGGLPYGLTPTAAQALAAQLQQRQAAAAAAAAAAGGNGGQAAATAQLLTQQVLLQQAAAAAAVQRRSSEHQTGPVAADGVMAGKVQQQQQAAIGAFAAPNTVNASAAAQIAAMLLRNQQAAGGGAAAAPLTVESLTSVLVQRLAQQQQQQQAGGPAATGQLLAAALLKQQQQQQILQLGAAGGGAASQQQQQLQQLILQHQIQQQRQQLPPQQQQALLLQAAGAGSRSQGGGGAASPTAAGAAAAAALAPGGMLVLQAAPGAAGLMSVAGFGGAGLGGALPSGRHEGDVDMDEGGS